MASDPPALRPGRTAAVVAVLAALGVCGNHLGLQASYSVTFLFGSIFPLVAVALFGPAWGVAAAVVAATRTWLLWHHPWAIIIFGCEAAWVGLALRRERRSLLLADSLFWLCAGTPLVIFFYGGVMGIDAPGTMVIVLKQGLNGILNALVASLLVEHLPLRRWLLPGARERGAPVAHVIFHAAAALLMAPTLVLTFLSDNRESAEREARLVARMRAETEEVHAHVEEWLERYVQGAAAIAEAGQRGGLRQGPELQAELARLLALFPDFHNGYVADGGARTVAFVPPTNERGEPTVGLDFSDRHYFAELKRTGAPVVSDIFMARGGVFTPVFSISAPVVEGGALRGFGLGAVNVDRLAGHLRPAGGEEGVLVTLVDRQGNVVASTDAGRRPLAAFSDPPVGRGAFGGPWLHVPRPGPALPSMKTWTEAVYLTRSLIERTGWQLVLERPAAPLRHAAYEATIHNLGLVAGLYLVALLIATVVSRALSSTPRTLAAISRDLPARIEDGREPEWPSSRVEELGDLIENFRHTASALRERIRAIQEANARLEARVEERTRELSEKTRQLEELNQSLEARIGQAVTELRSKDRMLIAQGLQAALGEMLGNISHQWRQPLNALGLVVSNLRDESRHGGLDAAQVEKAAADAQRLIQKMSSTINDFRDFVRPGKERSAFSALQQVTTTLGLLDPTFRSAGIQLELQAEQDAELFGVPNEYSQVLLNLLSNAKEAIQGARPGGGRVTLRLSVRDGLGCLTVRDDGGGVPPALLERIFEPYFSTKEGGTGIGLYMSKQIVERSLGGRLEVRNVEGGAEFTVLTPLAAAARPAADPARA